jgi:8-oxo-dGTP diphosphatase
MKKDRATGVIIRDNKLLLMYREKDNEQYYILPGGGIEPGETPEQTVLREIVEECSSHSTIKQFLFSHTEEGRKGYYFLLDMENKEPILGGPEKKRHSKENYYEFVWLDVEEFAQLENFYPPEAQAKLLSYL